MTADPYGLSEYHAQSSIEPSRPVRDLTRDARGNTLLMPRGIPTQQEADEAKGDVYGRRLHLAR